ncbi:hypothetical protein [Endothiovibrio diazotrophicus]
MSSHCFSRTSTSLLLLLALFTMGRAAAETTEDPRQSLGLTPGERVQFLSEMRGMLASVQGIVAGIATEDRDRIIAAAHHSGNRMARATPDSVRAKLPHTFKALGGPTHLLFEELAVRAEVEEMDSLTALTGELMKQCLACHEQFRAN